MRIQHAILTLFLSISFCFSREVHPYYQIQYNKSQVAFKAHIVGSALQNIATPTLIALAMADDNGGFGYLFLGVGTFSAGTIVKIPAEISLGVRATRASEQYSDTNHFSWTPFIVGVGALGLSGMASSIVLSDAGSVVSVICYIISEVFFSIHAIRAIRTTGEIVEEIENETLEISFSVAPIFTQSCSGVALQISF